MSEILLSGIVFKIFQWIWESSKDDISNSSTKYLKKSWDKIEISHSAKKYTEDMKRQHGFIHIWRMASPVELKEIFIPVNILSIPSSFRHISRKDLQNLYMNDNKYRETDSKKKEGLQIVQNTDKLFIIGKPGTGKTTFLKYLVLNALEGQMEYIPIFIPLRQFSESGTSLLDFIVKQFQICDFPDAKPFVEMILRKGKAMVLCDGLEEVNQDDGKRYLVVQELINFSNEFDKNQFIITSRVANYSDFFKGFTYVELASFNKEQIHHFITKWFHTTDNPFLAKDTSKHFIQAIERSDKRSMLAHFNQTIERSKWFYDIAKTPLFLTLLCISFGESLRLPTRRSELYEEAIDALLKTWDVSRNIKRDQIFYKLTLSRRRAMFAYIAASAFEKGEFLFSQGQLEEKIIEYLQKLPTDSQNEEIDGAAIIKV